LCTRCREFRHVEKDSTHIPFPVVRRYRSSNGEEFFLSIEDEL
jgi:histone acetyltransferase (RNA polymerase elongator complex component)